MNNLALLERDGRDFSAALELTERALGLRAVTMFREVGADDATRLPEIWKLVNL